VRFAVETYDLIERLGAVVVGATVFEMGAGDTRRPPTVTTTESRSPRRAHRVPGRSFGESLVHRSVPLPLKIAGV